MVLLPILNVIPPILNIANTDGQYLWLTYIFADEGTHVCNQDFIDDRQRLATIARFFPFVGVAINMGINWSLCGLGLAISKEISTANKSGPAI